MIAKTTLTRGALSAALLLHAVAAVAQVGAAKTDVKETKPPVLGVKLPDAIVSSYSVSGHSQTPPPSGPAVAEEKASTPRAKP